MVRILAADVVTTMSPAIEKENYKNKKIHGLKNSVQVENYYFCKPWKFDLQVENYSSSGFGNGS